MGKSKRRERQSDKSVGQAARQRLYFHMAVLLLVLAAVAAGAFYLLHGQGTAAPSPAAPAAKESAAAPGAGAGFDRLKGRWLRPDGGYVIEIRGIDPSGKMDVGYFNPRPINVSQAQATQEGTTTKVFIELRDINYPGSTYTLTYDPQDDQLKGVYFQAALKQSFEVVFDRLK